MSIAGKLPPSPIHRMARPLRKFLQIESAGGVVLLICALFALLAANSPWAHDWERFCHTRVALQIGSLSIGGELGHFFVNDVLMTIFFFVVGLEIKRELVAGELREPRKAALPVIAALGGMLIPAGIYLAVMTGEPGERGWGIPMATDIAFVVGVLALLGPRVPLGLKIMLLTLAIADDIGAVVVIAAFYNTGLEWNAFAFIGVGLGLTLLLRFAGLRMTLVYVIVGIGVWLGFYRSGVHPTVAGVILGLLTPTTRWVSRDSLRLALADLRAELDEEGSERVGLEDLRLLAFATRESVSPLDRLMTRLHPWVGFVIMPLFALANAGVEIQAGALQDPIAFMVAISLFLGKPIGVVGFSWIAVKLGIARLPHGVNWRLMIGAGILAGIGFTMSLFVAGLALSAEHLEAGKIGTLAGSVVSALVGAAVLRWNLTRNRTS
jgi:NhaA family Na+:H+ antiporter